MPYVFTYLYEAFQGVRHNGIHHNGTWHNDIKYSNIKSSNQHNDLNIMTLDAYAEHSVEIKFSVLGIIMLNVVILSAIMLSVEVHLQGLHMKTTWAM
jgi:hypothetical protein